MKRRAALAGIAALFTGACSKIADTKAGASLFAAAENWHLKAHRALADRRIPMIEGRQDLFGALGDLGQQLDHDLPDLLGVTEVGDQDIEAIPFVDDIFRQPRSVFRSTVVAGNA